MACLDKIYNGVVAFPLLAAVFVLPCAFSRYHRCRAVSRLRTLILYSFVLYLLISYLSVILPLPDHRAVVSEPLRKHLNLLPFRQIWLYWHRRKLTAANVFAYLKSASLWQLLLNVLMTVPFGGYLRCYFKQSFPRTTLYSFLLSLFFELTQFTGLYGIYPAPYRFADMDDLICNTLGGVIGYCLAALCSRLFPYPNRNDSVPFRD